MTYSDLKHCAKDIAEEVHAQYDTVDHESMIDQQVESSPYVIYYHWSWEVVETTRNANSELLYQAEEDFLSSRKVEFESLNQIMSHMAFWILHTLASEELELLKKGTV